MPVWWRSTGYSKLPHNRDLCRISCPDCHGDGAADSWPDEQIAQCVACQEGVRVCKLHTCKMCDGLGAICPQCRGARSVYERPGGPAVRCSVCCPNGQSINREAEAAAVARYYARWRLHYPTAESVAEALAEMEQRRRAARDAYYAEWSVRNPRRPRQHQPGWPPAQVVDADPDLDAAMAEMAESEASPDA